MRLQPAFFDEDFAEAVRIIEIQLEIDQEASAAIPLEKYDDPKFPPIAFTGTGRGSVNRLSKVTGIVRKMRDAVRWHFVCRSIYDCR